MCLIENEKVGDNYIYITYIYKFNTEIIYFFKHITLQPSEETPSIFIWFVSNCSWNNIRW